MSGLFTVRINPLIAKKEWVAQPHLYDFYQEIARSSYADMLHDFDRNQMYFSAIGRAVNRTKAQRKRAIVLDIGTGTGILAMMASFLGADEVYACEAFDPVARCASNVVRRNGFGEKIKIIRKRSNELEVGEGRDLEHRANILIAEVFDTELIGEGALRTFSHALQHLMEPDCVVVPATGVIYCQAVESDLIAKWNGIRPIRFDVNKEIVIPEEVSSCRGLGTIHDVQMSQIPDDSYSFITKPIPMFEFDFTGRTELRLNNTSVKETKAIKSGKCDAIFMWWVLKMIEGGDEVIHNGPKWAHPMCVPQWRDHWMQGVYFPPTAVHVNHDQKMTIIGNHDDYSMWFKIQGDPLDVTLEEIERRPVAPNLCTCFTHLADSRSRLALKFDAKRMDKYVSMLRKVINKSSVCLCLGDGSLLPLVAAKLGAKKVFTLEPESFYQFVTQSFINANKLRGVIELITKPAEELVLDDLGGMEVDVLIAEPYFTNCVHPWDVVSFAHMRRVLNPVLNPKTVVIPEKGTVKCIAINFENLWKIRAPVGKVFVYNLVDFDDLIQRAMKECDAAVEPQQLWEYPGKAVSKEFDLITFDLKNPPSTAVLWTSDAVKVEGSSRCNGLALWVDYSFGREVISAGPVKPTQIGNSIEWPMNCTQGVNFIRPIDLYCHESTYIKYYVAINMESGEMTFRFEEMHSE